MEALAVASAASKFLVFAKAPAAATSMASFSLDKFGLPDGPFHFGHDTSALPVPHASGAGLDNGALPPGPHSPVPVLQPSPPPAPTTVDLPAGAQAMPPNVPSALPHSGVPTGASDGVVSGVFAQNAVATPPESAVPPGTEVGPLPNFASPAVPPPPGTEVIPPQLPDSILVNQSKELLSSVTEAAANFLPLEMLSGSLMTKNLGEVCDLGVALATDAASFVSSAQQAFDAFNSPGQLRSGADFL